MSNLNLLKGILVGMIFVEKFWSYLPFSGGFLKEHLSGNDAKFNLERVSA